MESNKKNFCAVSELGGFGCDAPSIILSRECRYYEDGESVWCRFNKMGECSSREARIGLYEFFMNNVKIVSDKEAREYKVEVKK